LRILTIPGFTRIAGPTTGLDPALDEEWTLRPSDLRAAALIEAGAYGATLPDAAAAALGERVIAAGTNAARLAEVLFDSALCGIAELPEQIIAMIEAGLAGARDLASLGEMLATVLGLWRHGRLLGTARSPQLAAVIDGAVTRVLWLAEGVRGGLAPADPGRLGALAATRDALLHASAVLGTDRATAVDVARRISGDPAAPPDLRGAAFGLGWSLGVVGDPVRALRGAAAPQTFGDWLAGLFALARDEVLAAGDTKVLEVLDELVTAMPEDEFLSGLPALRQAFEYFPPRERETIARRLLERRDLRGSARALLRTTADPLLIAEARALEASVAALLMREGLSP
jgi:hypothetical protein